jgi:hypothetical protein
MEFAKEDVFSPPLTVNPSVLTYYINFVIFNTFLGSPLSFSISYISLALSILPSYNAAIVLS